MPSGFSGGKYCTGSNSAHYLAKHHPPIGRRNYADGVQPCLNPCNTNPVDTIHGFNHSTAVQDMYYGHHVSLAHCAKYNTIIIDLVKRGSDRL
jgi:hypothetical protein